MGSRKLFKPVLFRGVALLEWRHPQYACAHGTGWECDVPRILSALLEVRCAGGGKDIDLLGEAQIAACFLLAQVD